VFAEVELEHLPEVSEEQTLGTIKLERSYIQHETARTRLRLGRMVMPFGIRIPAHWLMTTPILTRPPIEDMGHVQTHFVGVEGQYRLDIGKSTVDITGTIHLSWNPGNGVRIVAEHHMAQGSDALESDATAHDHSADHNHSGASGATTSGVVHTGILWLGASF
jgi:hypothetical protein